MNQDSQSIKGQTVKILPPIPIPSFPVPFLYPRNILWSYNQIYTCTPSNAITPFNTNFSFLYTVFHILVFSYNNRFWRSYQCIKNPCFFHTCIVFSLWIYQIYYTNPLFMNIKTISSLLLLQAMVQWITLYMCHFIPVWYICSFKFLRLEISGPKKRWFIVLTCISNCCPLKTFPSTRVLCIYSFITKTIVLRSHTIVQKRLLWDYPLLKTSRIKNGKKHYYLWTYVITTLVLAPLLLC